MEFTFAPQLHYLVHFADGDFVAHCLDMDLIGVGSTKEDAVCALNTAVRGFVYFALKTQSFDAFDACKRAPQRYQDMFETAKQTSGVVTDYLIVSPEMSPVQVKECHLTYCMAVAA